MNTATIKIPKGLPDDLVRQKIIEFEIILEEEAERLRLVEDERDLDEKALNNAVRSVIRDPKTYDKLSNIDKLLKGKKL
jgi:hypothetical protein